MPLHPTLFISLALATGIAMGAIFSYLEKRDFLNIEDLEKKRINYFLWTMWFLAIIFVVTIIILIPFEPNTAASFSPVGIIIASFIASASVMLSINIQMTLEKQRKERDWELEERKTNRDMYNEYLTVYSELKKYFKILSGGLEFHKLEEENYLDLIKNTAQCSFFPNSLKMYIDNVSKLSTQLIQSQILAKGTLEIMNELKKLEEDLDETFKPFFNF